MRETTHEAGRFTRLMSAITSHPLVYDIVQFLAGANSVRKWLAPFLAESQSHTLLDVGAGTGAMKAWLPSTTNYIWSDNDPNKLLGYRSRSPYGNAVLTDTSHLCFADRSIDYALCVAVAHHLSEEKFRLSLEELARVVKLRLFLLDALDCPSRCFSRALWKIDRGSYPRTASVLQDHLSEFFEIERVEIFQVFHRYLLCVARSKHISRETDS